MGSVTGCSAKGLASSSSQHQPSDCTQQGMLGHVYEWNGAHLVCRAFDTRCQRGCAVSGDRLEALRVVHAIVVLLVGLPLLLILRAQASTWMIKYVDEERAGILP